VIPFWSGNVLAVILLVVGRALLLRGSRLTAIVVPALVALLIGPTPFTRRLKVTQLRQPPPAAAPGARLRAISLPDGRVTFRIVSNNPCPPEIVLYPGGAERLKSRPADPGHSAGRPTSTLERRSPRRPSTSLQSMVKLASR
jgi:hypothetical protein